MGRLISESAYHVAIATTSVFTVVNEEDYLSGSQVKSHGTTIVQQVGKDRGFSLLRIMGMCRT